MAKAETTGTAMTGTPETLLPGDPARPAAALAVRTSLATAAVFTVCALLSTQVKAIRAGSPWQDDPYDVVVSFTQFFVPALMVLMALRSVLCRRDEPLPLFRAAQLVGAAVVSAVMIASTAVTDWVAVAARADHELWNGRTPWLITALGLLSALVVVNFLLQWRAFRLLPRRRGRRDGGDWVGDAVLLLEAFATRFPRAGGRPARWAARDEVVTFVRRHVKALTAAASLVAGLAVTTALAVGEGWTNPLLYAFGAVMFAGGVFAFSMICNAVLRIAVPPAAGSAPAAGGTRRAVHIAVVAGALGLPVSVALRDRIWSVVGPGGEDASVWQLILLTAGGGAVLGILAFAVSFAFLGRRR
ncbi:hypothetical protein [Amycolatopsis rhizosphaerae]|uniref:hypothetical protein n=1 Tax=Amycolatopsis rhizosphaerae TaxID=2053003 RepID=UPI0016439E6D|nr:hypothetical protein [Amycolatopsis rhizosphaerae]